MDSSKAQIIARLEREILPLQGFKPLTKVVADPGLGPMKYAFPNAVFPTGAIHEFLTNSSEDIAASSGFIACILSSLMRNKGAAIWISDSPVIFPPALKLFDVDPDRLIFIHPKEKDIPWVIEETLKCEGLAAVVAQTRELSFITSRRLQLAVEQSNVTGLIVRKQPYKLNTNAAVARWRISSLPSELEDDLPGVGFPKWNVELLKIRNGKPGKWQFEWRRKRLHIIPNLRVAPQEQRKVG